MAFSAIHPRSDPLELYYSKFFRLDALTDPGLSLTDFRQLFFQCIECHVLMTCDSMGSHVCIENKEMARDIEDPLNALGIGLPVEAFEKFFVQCSRCFAVMSKRTTGFHQC
jgi:hypothetical protein